MTVSGHLEAQKILEAYFWDLDAALATLPRPRREQLIGEIRHHVDEALEEHGAVSTANVREVLARVGQPEDIAAAALEEESERPPARGRMGSRWVTAAIAVVAVAGLAIALASVVAPGTSAPSNDRAPSTRSAQRHGAGSLPTSSTTRTSATSTTAPRTSTSSPSSDAVLPPATVPPVKPSCTLQLVYDVDGNVTPLLCPNGGVNTLAWQHYAGKPGAYPQLFQLGPYASPTQVGSAMCADYHNVFGTNPLTISAERLAAAYYGWKFGINPATEFVLSGCPST